MMLVFQSLAMVHNINSFSLTESQILLRREGDVFMAIERLTWMGNEHSVPFSAAEGNSSLLAVHFAQVNESAVNNGVKLQHILLFYNQSLGQNKAC